MNYWSNIIKTQYTFQVFLLGAVSIVVSVFTGRELFTYIAFVVLFTVFDVAGYGNMVHLTERWYDEKIIIPYRIMQNMFMVLSFILIFVYAGWLCLLACIAAWWLGGCDLLYYLVLKVEMKHEDYYWMKGWSVWLIITLFRKFFSIDTKISRGEFIAVGILGLAAGMVFTLVLSYKIFYI